MAVTVYAYSVEPGISRVTGFGSDMQRVVDELHGVRREIALEDGYEPSTSEVYAFDLLRPEFDQLFAVMSGDAELTDLILRNQRVVTTVSE